MSRRTLILLAVILLVIVLGVGGYLYWQQANAVRAAAAARQTATLEVGELVASVAGAGNLAAPEQSELSFAAGGVPITAIHVQVGDRVKKGDVLAEEQATDLETQVKLAENKLASAQAALDELVAPPTTQELAIAESKVKSAQASYDSAVAALQELQAPPSAAELQAARAQLASAQANYDSAAKKASMTNEQITVARASLEKARIALEAAQAAYNAVAWQDNATRSSQASDLQAATIDYESAQANYNLTLADMNDSAVKSAEATLVQAKSDLQNLLDGPSAQELASAQANVETASQNLMQAKSDLETLKNGPSEAERLTAQANVDAAASELEAARRALEQAQLIAPFDGIVAAVNGFVGQTASAGTSVITLVNTANLQIELSLSEVDVANVKPGQQVQLTFDALVGKTFPGTVLSVSPLGTMTSGVVNYTVTVGLENPDPAILPGMTAQASIITERVPEALIAPNRAVRTVGNRRMMTILFEGREIPLLVQTGLASESGTQILSATTMDGQQVNLQAGDTVVLNATTTSGSTQRGPGAVFGPGAAVPILR